MTEKRKDRRFTANEALAVKDASSKLTIGLLQDISHHGLLITGKGPFKVNATYKLKLMLPKSIMGHRSVEIDALCKRVAKNKEAKGFDAGFSFKTLEGDLDLVIRFLEAEYAVVAIPVE
ncbi:MAG: PilZ domain-containing protein [Candidatus Zixiibacteriota bacterium]